MQITLFKSAISVSITSHKNRVNNKIKSYISSHTVSKLLHTIGQIFCFWCGVPTWAVLDRQNTSSEQLTSQYGRQWLTLQRNATLL